ncbi:MAG: histidine--tRNA ligase [Patescibacteria group bacterium]|nr:MAG: histidine--tRNA ligase [Patescibacteria group bacterium]
MQQVQTLKGFRDFLPKEKNIRNYVTKKIKETFEIFGFEPIETPTLEYASLLMGKYGDEADKLIYSFEDQGGRKIALRYDQTVPTSRVLSQYQNELPKFFRRYQIQNVFRADKPQKGRFREFTQCDCDIFESDSTVVDAELLAVYYFVYQNLGLKSIKLFINDRTTLMNTISPFANDEVNVFSIIQSIDKLDKLSEKQVVDELIGKGLYEKDARDVLREITSATMSASLKETVERAVELGVDQDALVFTPTLARGLDYYTGIIFEGKVPEYSGGSVGGGGRYDRLIGELCGRDIKANGFAIGFDRTVEAVVELGLVPQTATVSSQVLVTVFDENLIKNSLNAAKTLRANNIRTEVYPEVDQIGKQFKLANQKNIPYVVVIGDAEVSENKVQLKNMASGEQELLTLEEVVKKIKQI